MENGKLLLDLQLVVIKSEKNFIPLFGRSWLDSCFEVWREKFYLNVGCVSVNAVNEQTISKNRRIESVKTKFNTVFFKVLF